MDEIHECERWINNLFQKLASLWEELEEFKEPVSYYGRVGDSVRKLYSDAVQEISLRHSNSTDLVETSTSSNVAFKVNTVQSNINKIKEAPLVPTDFCREQITSEISGCSVQQGDSLTKKNSNKDVPVHLHSFTNSQEDVGSSKCKNSSEPFMFSGRVEKKYDADCSAKILNKISENYFDNRVEEEGIFCDVSSVTDGLIFQDADWDIAKLDMYSDCSEEKCCNDGFAKISNEFSGNQFSNTKKEEGVLCNASLETDALTFDHADWGLPYMFNLNSGTDVDFEDLKMDTVALSTGKQPLESCVIVESGKRPPLPSSKIKSYKKMIKDAFMLRKKVTKEYMKMPISYADKDLSQLTEETIPKSAAQKLIDFDWELV